MAEVLGELASGTSSIKLSARLHSGPFELEAREFACGGDRTVIAQGRTGSVELYRAFFSHDGDAAVFAVVSDNGVTTKIALADSEEPGIGRVTVWNDGADTQEFRVDVERFLETRDPLLSILDGEGAELDHVGRRRPPDVSPEEIVDAFADHQAFKDFMRGHEHHERQASQTGTNWKCAWICLIPACGILCLFWSPLKKPLPKKQVG